MPHDVLEAAERSTVAGQGLSRSDALGDPHRELLRLGIAEVQASDLQDLVG